MRPKSKTWSVSRYPARAAAFKLSSWSWSRGCRSRSRFAGDNCPMWMSCTRIRAHATKLQSLTVCPSNHVLHPESLLIPWVFLFDAVRCGDQLERLAQSCSNCSMTGYRARCRTSASSRRDSTGLATWGAFLIASSPNIRFRHPPHHPL